MATTGQLDAVTGAFGFTGRAIAGQLLGTGRQVVTLSRRSGAGDPLGARLRVEPLVLQGPEEAERTEAALAESGSSTTPTGSAFRARP